MEYFSFRSTRPSTLLTFATLSSFATRFMNLENWVPPTLVRDYYPRKPGYPAPVAQDIPYYRRVGWSRTVRGKRVKRQRKILWVGADGLITVPTFNPKHVYPIEATPLTPHTYKVRSQRWAENFNKVWYKVKWKGSCTTSSCKCPDWAWNQVCKHIRAVRRHRRITKRSLPEEDKDAFEDENLETTFSEEDDKVLNEGEEIQGQLLGLRWGPEY